ncbi:cupin [Aliidongia dinghuensis]|uniref:Cupin n=1 Tax=Aliidongia dinghuensis TaxID=1867774 RepID=A0A8J2YQD9_9PROT|nr:cupin domain-containing protein [Aliidongia dinghuensis]GGF04490.1 cupin [Aliidongia dinghuensis]
MSPGKIAYFAPLCALLVGAAPAYAAPVRETVTPQSSQVMPNLPGKSLVTVVVSYPPGAKSAPHHHAGSAFIYAYVLEGEIRSQVDDAPPRVYRAGESWVEAPGAHHKASENASKTKPAKLLAVFVVDSDEKTLTTPDPQ